MKAEIITIGDEILIGQTIDGNSSYIAAGLNNIGIEITGISTVPDEASRITDMLSLALQRANLVIMTGGLGPTSDDITKKTLCDFFNTRIVRNEEVLANISQLLGRRQVSLNSNNLAQADVPEKCTVLMNHVGTAPGMWFENNGNIVVSLPGVPFEMKYLMSEYVIPMIKKSGVVSTIVHKNIMTYGLPEAHLAELLTGFEAELPKNIKLAYLPSSGVIKLRLTAKGEDPKRAQILIKNEVDKLYSIIPNLIYAEDEVSLEEEISRLLINRKLTLSLAESCTGGNIARLLTSIPGSSAWFKGSVVAYSNDLKQQFLRVPISIIIEHGAVSRECAVSMAENMRLLTGSDFAVSTTGIAGPSGGSPEKPVGTVWIAVSGKNGTVAEKNVYGTDRLINIRRFSLSALGMLRKQIISD